MRRVDVTRRLTAVSEVRASTGAHRDRVGRQLDERPALTPEGAYSQAYFDHMDSELAKVEQDLVEAEDVHVRKQIQISQAQQESEQLTSIVYDKQTSARQILVGLYGSEHQFELAAVSGKTPQGPMTLPEQVDQTVKLMRNPEGETPAVKIGGVEINFGVMADDLETDLGRYRASRVELERRRKEGDATRLASNQAIEAFDQVFPWVASSLQGTFRLVGERDLADRIRTSARQVTRRRDGEEEEPESDSSSEPSNPEPSSGDSVAQPSEPSAQTPPTAS